MKIFFRKYFEVIVFTSGLVLLAFMDPYTANGPGFCILENLGFPYCPGDGLGHSIAYIFRGEISNAMQANVLGPFALVILSGRIVHLLVKNHKNSKIKL
jgi:hypothetical protein